MKKNYWLIMLIAVLALGVGYAAIGNISLAITGGATAKGNPQQDFKVRFVKESDLNSEFESVRNAAVNPAGHEASAGSTANATASITADTEATFSITGLKSVGEYVTFTYYVVNLSEGLPAYVYVDVINSTNDASDYFKVTKTVRDSELTEKGSVTPVTVKVEVIALPKSDITGNFNVKLVASDTKNTNVTTNGISTVYTSASTTNEIDELLADENIDNLVLKLSDDIEYGEKVINVAEKNITIDLNGNDLSLKQFFVDGGTLSLEGEGNVDLTSDFAFRLNGTSDDVQEYSVINVGKDVVINSNYPLSDGAYVFAHASKTVNGVKTFDDVNGVKVNFNGTINSNVPNFAAFYVNGTYKQTADEFNIGPDAVINSETGIYAAGDATWNISGTINSDITGIEIRAGKLNITGGKITATYIPTEAEANGNGATTKGAAVAIAQHTTKLPIEVNISGGEFTAFTDVYQSNPQNNSQEYINLVKLNITGGTFKTLSVSNGDPVPTRNVYSENLKNFISGGTFDIEPDASYMK